MANKKRIVEQFIDQNLDQPQELFTVHQTVCNADVVSEAERDVLLLTEFPERLNESLMPQWRADVMRALCQQPCWRDATEQNLEQIFETFCVALHAAVERKKPMLVKPLTIIDKVVDQPDTMGQFETPLKRWLNSVMKL